MALPSEDGLYRVLSLDGGGRRGLLSVLFLERLERARPGLLARTTLFAGTSAGGVSALILASGTHAVQRLRDCLEFWERPGLFANTAVGTLLALTGTAPVYSNRGLSRALRQTIDPELRLDELGRCVAIPTVELDSRAPRRRDRRWWPRMFHNFDNAADVLLRLDRRGVGDFDLPGLGRRPDGDERVVDVALRTCSFPMGMPSYQGYLDGALYANNPSLGALGLVFGRERLLANGGVEGLIEQDGGVRVAAPMGHVLDQVRMLSIGTGHNHFFERGAPSWGIAQWMLDPLHPGRFVDVMSDSLADMINGQCMALLASNYCRLSPRLPESDALVEQTSERIIPDMYEVAERTDLTYVLRWIDESGWLRSGGSSA
jgi:uncharacterized protein